MVTVILVIHILIALALVGVILLQRSEGGALGIGGGGGGAGGGMMSSRGAANLLTRATGILAACFIATSITLAILSGGSDGPSSVIETTGPQSPASGAPTQERSGPSVPLSQ